MKLSFQEKSIWVSLMTTLLIFGYYFTKAITVFRNPETNNETLVGLFIGIIILVILVQIILQGTLALAHRKNAAEMNSDERDRMIELKATRISYFILVFGVWAAGTSMLISNSVLYMANIILFFFIMSEIVGFAAQLVYYRRGF